MQLFRYAKRGAAHAFVPLRSTCSAVGFSTVRLSAVHEQAPPLSPRLTTDRQTVVSLKSEIRN